VKQDSGEADVANGVATVADTSTNAKLKVTFLPSWLRWTGLGLGDYWVIQLGDNYEYSVVSEPGRNYLWILSRTPELDAATYSKILDQLVLQGFDISKIELSRR
jgi:apolipoprotein D and lipocalin family protein